jgi:hypothetical protein
MKKKDKNIINGLSDRHVSQIIRRKMMEKTMPSKKAYKRIKYKVEDFK